MRTFAFVVALGFVVMPAQVAFACDCVGAPVAQAVKDADIVLSGVVISARLAHPQQAEGEALTIVELRVLRGWKSAAESVVTLHTQRNLFSCDGHEFVVGQRYLVFAARNAPSVTARYGLTPSTVTYGVRLCGGTATLDAPNTRERERQLERLIRQ